MEAEWPVHGGLKAEHTDCPRVQRGNAAMFRFTRFVLSVGTLFALGMILGDSEDANSQSGIQGAISGYELVDRQPR